MYKSAWDPMLFYERGWYTIGHAAVSPVWRIASLSYLKFLKLFCIILKGEKLHQMNQTLDMPLLYDHKTTSSNEILNNDNWRISRMLKLRISNIVELLLHKILWEFMCIRMTQTLPRVLNKWHTKLIWHICTMFTLSVFLMEIKWWYD